MIPFLKWKINSVIIHFHFKDWRQRQKIFHVSVGCCTCRVVSAPRRYNISVIESWVYSFLTETFWVTMENKKIGVPKNSGPSKGAPAQVQDDFIHGLNCSDGNCLLPICVNSKLLFNHSLRCTDANCSFCQQLKHQAPNHTQSSEDIDNAWSIRHQEGIQKISLQESPGLKQRNPRTRKPTRNSSSSKFRQGQCTKSPRPSSGHWKNKAMMTRFSTPISQARTPKHLTEHETVPSHPVNSIPISAHLDLACRHEDSQVQAGSVSLDRRRLGSGGKLRESSRELLKVRFFSALMGLMRLITKSGRRSQIFLCIGLLRGALHEVQNHAQCK